MRIIAVLSSYAVLILLIISSLAGFIPPSQSSIIAIAGLAFPVIWIVNLILLIVIWLFGFKKHIIPSIILSLITLPVMLDIFSPGINKNVKDTKYSILSFNTFGLRILNDQGNQHENQVILNNTLNYKNFTILCFQEYPMKGSKHAKFYEQLMKGLEC